MQPCFDFLNGFSCDICVDLQPIPEPQEKRSTGQFKTGYGPSGHISDLPELGTTPSSILSAPRPGYRGVRACRKTRTTGCTDTSYRNSIRGGPEGRHDVARVLPGRTIPWNVEGLAGQFQSRPTEIKRFVRDNLESAQTRELAERMRMAGLSL